MIKRSKAATACRKRKRLATISTVEFAEREIEQSRSYRQALELPSKAAATGRSSGSARRQPFGFSVDWWFDAMKVQHVVGKPARETQNCWSAYQRVARWTEL